MEFYMFVSWRNLSWDSPNPSRTHPLTPTKKKKEKQLAVILQNVASVYK